ncbi:DUF4962 domain-containing protein, partial [bacterium]|nr:DUF4962 domain-containing protein [bacterium]
LNPPRFSWPYLPQSLVPGTQKLKAFSDLTDLRPTLKRFTLQLSQAGDFIRPDLEIRDTPYNFYNALPVLEKTTWHWRVGYDAGTDSEQWSPVRTFSFDDNAVDWDRTLIESAVQKLADLPHPRLGPPQGDWQAWRKRLESREPTASWLRETLLAADAVTTQPWWNDFPKTDAKGQSRYDKAGQWNEITQGLTLASFAWHLTGDERFRPARDYILRVANFAPGGRTAPEYHGATSKWATQCVRHLAVCYDWWYPDLTPEERKIMQETIAWRLGSIYKTTASWILESKGLAWHNGVAIFASSHPYENFMWALPAVLLTAGDHPLSDELTPLCLHYLTGVTAAHGPEEAWNEGLAYGTAKSYTMLRASLCANLLLPELQIGNNPLYARLNEWFTHLTPIGLQRLSFGEYAGDVPARYGVMQKIARVVSWLSNDPQAQERWQSLAGIVGDSVLTDERLQIWSLSPWFEIAAADRFSPSEPVRPARNALFPEAGWVMVDSACPSDSKAFDDAFGMIFKCRPRGGYSHSYRSENDFVWHALGQTIGTSGGRMAYPDPHSRHSMSHNVILINGVGQEWGENEDPRVGWWQPAYPFQGRLLSYEEGDGYIHWVGDATHAYQTIPGLLRWHRHVVFLESRWFAMYDDLAMRPDADPASFSWLYHVYPNVKLDLDKKNARLTYPMDNVIARVSFGNPPDTLDMVDMPKRQGFLNRITGEDFLDARTAALSRVNRLDAEENWMSHNLWITNRQPAREFAFLTALTAWRDGDTTPTIQFDETRKVTVTWPDGSAKSVSFSPETSADFQIDVPRIRDHAIQTDPGVLPPHGETESVRIGADKYQVEWLQREDFEKPNVFARWVVEGNALVETRDGRLHLKSIAPDRQSRTTIWYRPEVPANAILTFRAAIPKHAQDETHLSLYLHAREEDGEPLRFGRLGRPENYGSLPKGTLALDGIA